MSGEGEGKVACVTGASGYIASWLVKLLLLRGYTVRASVRNPTEYIKSNFDPQASLILCLGFDEPFPNGPLYHLLVDDPKKTEHLLALDGAKERLHLFQADLLEEGSFDPIVDGCEGVFHTASPVHFSVSDPQAELIDPALKGTVNVLRSCAKVPSIKRVVLTSSMAAVMCNQKMLTPGLHMDETWFSDPLFCKESKLSKTLAEEAAWKFAKENGIDLTVINPGWVIGPLLQPTLNATVEVVLNVINECKKKEQEEEGAGGVEGEEEENLSLQIVFFEMATSRFGKMSENTGHAKIMAQGFLIMPKGAKSFLNASYRWVDVRDVANAHIQAFEIPSASGRYCVVNRVAHFSEVVKILRELYPALDIPEKCENDAPFQMGNVVVNEKAKGLGIEFTPLEVTLKDTVECLKEKNFVAL
ncbi:unnamed protein product [Camellia sinensis]